MPVVRFRVRNEYGHADPELYGAADRDDPEALLEGVAMAGLVGVLRQLGDLAEFAAGIFHNLHEEVMSTSARGHSLMLRVQQLEAEFPAIEKAFLSETTHLHTINNTGTEWHPNIQIGQNLITSGDMPRFILDSYEGCRGPPRLFMLDKFDVAGAGACLKRYSDPSFFKTDLTSSGAIEAGLQREKRPRKTKKKILRGRNDENLESSPDHHTLILKHMHPEKAQTLPTKRVKLKTRPLNNKDAATRSYMECVLESYISNEHISNINTIEHSPEETTSFEPNVPIIEIHASTTVVSSDNYLSLDKQVQSATDRGVEGENADGEKKNEIEQMITKSLPIDETGLLLQSFDSPEQIKRKDEGNALEQLFKENSVQLNQHVVPADTEDRTDAGSDAYVSDDIASDLENYMDALATIDSEIETDSENRPKHQFSPSNEELQEMDPETPDEKKMKNLQILSANLTEDQSSNSLSEREVSCLANKDFLSILSADPDSVQKGHVQSPMCENAEITFSPVNKDSFCDPIQPLRVDEVHSLAHQNQSSSDLPVNAGANSGGEHDLIFEQGHIHVSEKLFDMSSSIFETVEASCSSLPMNSASPTDSGTQGSCGTNNPTCVNPYTTYFGSLDAGGVCQQSDFTPGKNFATTDIANIVSSTSDDADSTRALIRISDSDFKCLVDDYETPSRINESPIEGAQIEDAIPDVSQEVLLDAENLTLITNSEGNHEVIPCLDYAINPTQDTLTAGIPNSDRYDGVCSWNDQSLHAAGEVEPCLLQKNEIDGHPGSDILSVNAQRDAPVTSLDVSPDAIVAEPGSATTVSDTKDSDDMRSTFTDVNGISFVDKNQTFKAERDELFPNNAVSEKLPVPSSTDHDLLGSVEVFSDALDNDGIKLSVIPEDQVPLSSSCITSESCLPSVEEHKTPSNFVSDHPKSEENNYGQHYSPFSHSSVQLSKDTTTSDRVPEKHDPEKDECVGSVIQEELVTNRASGIPSSQDEENGETPNQASEEIFYHEKLSSSCGELSALKSVSADRDKTGEQDVAQEALPRHGFVPDMPDENANADVSVTELHAQRTCEDPCQENEEVEIGNNEKEPRQENIISVREPTDLNPGQLCQYLDKEEVEVAVIQNISAKEEIIFQSPGVSYSDTMNVISFVHMPLQDTAVSRDEDNSRALLAESDAGPNVEPLSHRTAEGYVSLTPEHSTAGTIQLTSESISSVIPISISDDKENSSDQDSQLDAVHILEQVCFSHASLSLSDSQTVPSMPGRSSVTDGSKDNIETDLSHSKTDSISLTDSGMIPFSFSLKSSSETLGRKDESNLLLLSSSTSEVEAHSEAKVALQSDFKLLIMPSDHSPQLSVASFSGPNLLVANPALINAPESTGNGLLFNFPLSGPDIQCNLNDTPPLPPLPPLQWRMGKPKISQLRSIAATSKSSGSDDFSIISANELPSNDAKTLGVSVQGAETFSQPVFIENQISQGSSTDDVPSLASANTALTEKEGAGRFGSVSVYSHEENMRTRSLSSVATDVKIENSLRRRKALQDEMAPSTDAFAPLLPSSEIDSQRISSISYTEQMRLSSQSILPPTQGIDVHQNYTVMPQSFQTDLLYPSNPFRDAPVTMDPRYQYGYRLFGGESLQPLATQDIIPRHGFYMPVGENMYGPYSISLPEMETEKLNGRPLSILNRPRDPLIEAVASHDKSTLRKVSEIIQTSAKPKDDERNTMLDQIKQKSFNLKRTAVTRPSISKGPTTNLKVAAILEKANAIRQAFAGSDDEDNWSDG